MPLNRFLALALFFLAPRAPAGAPECLISGPSSACPGQPGLAFSAPVGFASYDWTVQGNGVLVGSSTGTVVQVDAGALCSTPLLVNLTVSDGVSSFFCQRVATVRDTTPPVPVGILPNQVVSCLAEVPLPLQPDLVDGCSSSLRYTVQTLAQVSSLPGSCTRIVAYRWTVRDDCGNLTRVSQRILVRDVNPPVVECQNDLTVTARGDGLGALPDVTLFSYDECDGPLLATQDPPVGTLVPFGPHTVSLTARDACGNLSSSSTTVTVLPPSSDIQILKSVYVGHDGGARCPGLEQVQGVVDTPVTYCFRVVNTGQSNLADVQVSDPALNLPSIAVGALAAGQATLLFAESTVTADLVNHASVSGRDLVDALVTATDTAAVDLVHPALVLDAGVTVGYGPTMVCPGSSSTFAINGYDLAHCLKVTNTGDVPLRDVVIHSGNQEESTVYVGLLAPGQSHAAQIHSQVQGSHTNFARAVGVPAFGAPLVAEDTSIVFGFGPHGRVEKTVYAGQDGGASCPGGGALALSGPAPVTYCFKFTNEGDSNMFFFGLADPQLGLTWAEHVVMQPGAVRHYFAETNVVGIVTNTAVATWELSGGFAFPRDSAVVAPFTASLRVHRAVYEGHVFVGDCDLAGPAFTAPLNHPVTHCTIVENTGSTHLWDVRIEDKGLGVGLAEMFMTHGTLPLAPGQKLTAYYQARVQGPLHAQTLVTARPVTADLVPVSGLADAEGSAGVALDVGPLSP